MTYLDLFIKSLTAILFMVNERIEAFILVLMFLLMYTLPIGYVILKNFKIFKDRNLNLFEQLLLSFSIGIVFLVIIALFSTFIKFSIFTITILEIIIILLCLIFNKKPENFNKQENNYKSIISKRIKIIFLIILALYYFVVPLTTDYAHFRDYALLTLGFEENSASLLPLYDIGIYYPPGSSLVAGLIHMWLPNINPIQIMLILSYFFVFIIVLLYYILGKVFLESEILGLFFSSSFLIGSVSKNFVTGGATIPSSLSIICGFTFFMLFIEYLRIKLDYRDINGKKIILLSGLSLGAATISHFDTLLTFLWGFLSINLTLLIFNKNIETKKIIYSIIIIGLISFLIASPFLLRSYSFKSQLDKFWTNEIWDEYSKDEIHPKPLSEIMFFTGHLLFVLGIISILLFILQFLYKYYKSGIFNYDELDLFHNSIVFWIVLILISNSFFFLRLAKPLFLFYAINTILWHGITIPLTLAVGLLFYKLYNRFSNTKMKNAFLFCVLFLMIFSVINYETINYPQTFKGQGGFLLLPFADRAGYVNQGDIKIFNLLKTLPKGKVLNYPSTAGDEAMIMSTQPTYTYFTHYFYDDIEKHEWMLNQANKSREFFKNPVDSFLISENISYIFLPSEINLIEHYSPEILMKYELIAREGGAKLLSTNKTRKPIFHFEAENVSSNNNVKEYKYGNGFMLAVKTIELKNNDFIIVPIKIPNEFLVKKNQKVRLYIKHLTFLSPLSFDLIIGNERYSINKTTNKLTFSESHIETTLDNINNKNITLVETSEGIDFFKIKKYYPEIDWLEIEII